MTIGSFLIQIAISLAVVGIYHLWVTSKREPSALLPPVVIPPAASIKTTPTPELISPEIFAVIAAAIAVVLDRPHRVVSVQQGASHTPEVNVWALEGRMEHFMSHKVR